MFGVNPSLVGTSNSNSISDLWEGFNESITQQLTQGIFDASIKPSDSSLITDTSLPFQDLFLTDKLTRFMEGAVGTYLTSSQSISALSFLQQGPEGLSKPQLENVRYALSQLQKTDIATQVGLSAKDLAEVNTQLGKLASFKSTVTEAKISPATENKLLRFLNSGKHGLDLAATQNIRSYILGVTPKPTMTPTLRAQLKAFMTSALNSAQELQLSEWDLSEITNFVQMMDTTPIDPIEASKAIREDLQATMGASEVETTFRSRMNLVDADNPKITALIQELFANGTLKEGMPQDQMVAELLNWVQTNFRYETDMTDKNGVEKDYWQNVEETLAKGAGDCEDLSILQASLLSNLLMQQGMSRAEVRDRVFVSAGYVTDESGVDRGHALVTYHKEDGSITTLDATNTKGPEALDETKFRRVFELNDSQFNKYAVVNEMFSTALRIGALNIDPILTRLTTRMQNIAVQLVPHIDIPKIQSGEVYKQITSYHLLQGEGFPINTTDSELAKYYYLNTKEKALSLSSDATKLAAFKELYGTGANGYYTAYQAANTTERKKEIADLIDDYLKNNGISLYKKLDSSSSTFDTDFTFFTLKKRTLSDANIANAAGGLSVIGDLSALGGGQNLNGANPISKTYIEAEVKADAMFNYSNAVIREMNEINYMYNLLAIMMDSIRNQLALTETKEMSESDRNRIISEYQKTDSKAKKMLGAISNFLYTSSDAIQDVTDMMFEFATNINNAMYKAQELSIEREFRGNFGAGIGSGLADEMVGTFELMRVDAKTRLYHNKARIIAKNTAAYLQLAVEFFGNLITLKTHNALPKFFDADNDNKNRDFDLVQQLYEDAREELGFKITEGTSTDEGGVVKRSFTIDDANLSDSLYGTILKKFDVDRASTLTRFGARGLETDSTNQTISGKIFTSAEGSQRTFLDINYTKIAQFRSLLAKTQNAIRFNYMIAQQQLNVTMQALSKLPGLFVAEGVDRMENVSMAALNADIAKLSQMTDKFIASSNELTSSVNELVRNQNELKKAKVSADYKQARTLSMIAGYIAIGISSGTTGAATALAESYKICSPMAAASMSLFFTCMGVNMPTLTTSWTSFYFFSNTTTLDNISDSVMSGRMLGLEYEVHETHYNHTLMNSNNLQRAGVDLGFGAEDTSFGTLLSGNEPTDPRNKAAYHLDRLYNLARHKLNHLSAQTTITRGKNLGTWTWTAGEYSSFLRERGDGFLSMDGAKLARFEDELSKIEMAAVLVAAILQAILSENENAASRLDGTVNLDVAGSFQPFFDETVSFENFLQQAYRSEVYNVMTAVNDTARKQQKVMQAILTMSHAGVKLGYTPLARIPTPISGAGIAEVSYTVADSSHEFAKINIDTYARPYTGYWADYHSKNTGADEVNFIRSLNHTLGDVNDSINDLADDIRQNNANPTNNGMKNQVQNAWDFMNLMEDQYLYHIFGTSDLSFNEPSVQDDSGALDLVNQARDNYESTTTSAQTEQEARFLVEKLEGAVLGVDDFIDDLALRRSLMAELANPGLSDARRTTINQSLPAITARINDYQDHHPDFGAETFTSTEVFDADTDVSISQIVQNNDVETAQQVADSYRTRLTAARDGLAAIIAAKDINPTEPIRTRLSQLNTHITLVEELIRRMRLYRNSNNDSSIKATNNTWFNASFLPGIANFNNGGTAFGEDEGTNSTEIYNTTDIETASEILEKMKTDRDTIQTNINALANLETGDSTELGTAAGSIRSIQKSTDGPEINLMGMDTTEYAEVYYQPIIDSRKEMTQLFMMRLMMLTIVQAYATSVLQSLGSRANMGSVPFSSFISAVEAYNDGQLEVLNGFLEETTSRVDSYTQKFLTRQSYVIQSTALSIYIPLIALAAAGRKIASFALASIAITVAKQIFIMAISIGIGRAALKNQLRNLPNASLLLFNQQEDTSSNITARKRNNEANIEASKRRKQELKDAQGTANEQAELDQYNQERSTQNAAYRADLTNLNKGRMTLSEFNDKYNTNYKFEQQAKVHLSNAISETEGPLDSIQEAINAETEKTADLTQLGKNLTAEANVENAGFSEDFLNDTINTGRGSLTFDPSIAIAAKNKINREARKQKMIMQIMTAMQNQLLDAASNLSGKGPGVNTGAFLGVINHLKKADKASVDFMNKALQTKVEQFNRFVDKIITGATEGLKAGITVAFQAGGFGMEKYSQRATSKAQKLGSTTSLSAGAQRQIGGSHINSVRTVAKFAEQLGGGTSSLMGAAAADDASGADNSSNDTYSLDDENSSTDFSRDTTDALQNLDEKYDTAQGNIADTGTLEAQLENYSLQESSSTAGLHATQAFAALLAAFSALMFGALMGGITTALRNHQDNKNTDRLQKDLVSSRLKTLDVAGRDENDPGANDSIDLAMPRFMNSDISRDDLTPDEQESRDKLVAKLQKDGVDFSSAYSRETLVAKMVSAEKQQLAEELNTNSAATAEQKRIIQDRINMLTEFQSRSSLSSTVQHNTDATNAFADPQLASSAKGLQAEVGGRGHIVQGNPADDKVRRVAELKGLTDENGRRIYTDDQIAMIENDGRFDSQGGLYVESSVREGATDLHLFHKDVPGVGGVLRPGDDLRAVQQLGVAAVASTGVTAAEVSNPNRDQAIAAQLDFQKKYMAQARQNNNYSSEQLSLLDAATADLASRGVLFNRGARDLAGNRIVELNQGAIDTALLAKTARGANATSQSSQILERKFSSSARTMNSRDMQDVLGFSGTDSAQNAKLNAVTGMTTSDLRTGFGGGVKSLMRGIGKGIIGTLGGAAMTTINAFRSIATAAMTTVAAVTIAPLFTKSGRNFIKEGYKDSAKSLLKAGSSFVDTLKAPLAALPLAFVGPAALTGNQWAKDRLTRWKHAFQTGNTYESVHKNMFKGKALFKAGQPIDDSVVTSSTKKLRAAFKNQGLDDNEATRLIGLVRSRQVVDRLSNGQRFGNSTGDAARLKALRKEGLLDSQNRVTAGLFDMDEKAIAQRITPLFSNIGGKARSLELVRTLKQNDRTQNENRAARRAAFNERSQAFILNVTDLALGYERDQASADNELQQLSAPFLPGGTPGSHAMVYQADGSLKAETDASKINLHELVPVPLVLRDAATNTDTVVTVFAKPEDAQDMAKLTAALAANPMAANQAVQPARPQDLATRDAAIAALENFNEASGKLGNTTTALTSLTKGSSSLLGLSAEDQATAASEAYFKAVREDRQVDSRDLGVLLDSKDLEERVAVLRGGGATEAEAEQIARTDLLQRTGISSDQVLGSTLADTGNPTTDRKTFLRELQKARLTHSRPHDAANLSAMDRSLHAHNVVTDKGRARTTAPTAAALRQLGEIDSKAPKLTRSEATDLAKIINKKGVVHNGVLAAAASAGLTMADLPAGSSPDLLAKYQKALQSYAAYQGGIRQDIQSVAADVGLTAAAHPHTLELLNDTALGLSHREELSSLREEAASPTRFNDGFLAQVASRTDVLGVTEEVFDTEAASSSTDSSPVQEALRGAVETVETTKRETFDAAKNDKETSSTNELKRATAEQKHIKKDDRASSRVLEAINSATFGLSMARTTGDLAQLPGVLAGAAVGLAAGFLGAIAGSIYGAFAKDQTFFGGMAQGAKLGFNGTVATAVSGVNAVGRTLVGAARTIAFGVTGGNLGFSSTEELGKFWSSGFGDNFRDIMGERTLAAGLNKSSMDLENTWAESSRGLLGRRLSHDVLDAREKEAHNALDVTFSDDLNEIESEFDPNYVNKKFVADSASSIAKAVQGLEQGKSGSSLEEALLQTNFFAGNVGLKISQGYDVGDQIIEFGKELKKAGLSETQVNQTMVTVFQQLGSQQSANGKDKIAVALDSFVKRAELSGDEQAMRRATALISSLPHATKHNLSNAYGSVWSRTAGLGTASVFNTTSDKGMSKRISKTDALPIALSRMSQTELDDYKSKTFKTAGRFKGLSAGQKASRQAVFTSLVGKAQNPNDPNSAAAAIALSRLGAASFEGSVPAADLTAAGPLFAQTSVTQLESVLADLSVLDQAANPGQEHLGKDIHEFSAKFLTADPASGSTAHDGFNDHEIDLFASSPGFPVIIRKGLTGNELDREQTFKVLDRLSRTQKGKELAKQIGASFAGTHEASAIEATLLARTSGDTTEGSTQALLEGLIQAQVSYDGAHTLDLQNDQRMEKILRRLEQIMASHQTQRPQNFRDLDTALLADYLAKNEQARNDVARVAGKGLLIDRGSAMSVIARTTALLQGNPAALEGFGQQLAVETSYNKEVKGAITFDEVFFNQLRAFDPTLDTKAIDRLRDAITRGAQANADVVASARTQTPKALAGTLARGNASEIAIAKRDFVQMVHNDPRGAARLMADTVRLQPNAGLRFTEDAFLFLPEDQAKKDFLNALRNDNPHAATAFPGMDVAGLLQTEAGVAVDPDPAVAAANRLPYERQVATFNTFFTQALDRAFRQDVREGALTLDVRAKQEALALSSLQPGLTRFAILGTATQLLDVAQYHSERPTEMTVLLKQMSSANAADMPQILQAALDPDPNPFLDSPQRTVKQLELMKHLLSPDAGSPVSPAHLHQMTTILEEALESPHQEIRDQAKGLLGQAIKQADLYLVPGSATANEDMLIDGTRLMSLAFKQGFTPNETDATQPDTYTPNLALMLEQEAITAAALPLINPMPARAAAGPLTQSGEIRDLANALQIGSPLLSAALMDLGAAKDIGIHSTAVQEVNQEVSDAASQAKQMAQLQAMMQGLSKADTDAAIKAAVDALPGLSAAQTAKKNGALDELLTHPHEALGELSIQNPQLFAQLVVRYHERTAAMAAPVPAPVAGVPAPPAPIAPPQFITLGESQPAFAALQALDAVIPGAPPAAAGQPAIPSLTEKLAKGDLSAFSTQDKEDLLAFIDGYVAVTPAEQENFSITLRQLDAVPGLLPAIFAMAAPDQAKPLVAKLETVVAHRVSGTAGATALSTTTLSTSIQQLGKVSLKEGALWGDIIRESKALYKTELKEFTHDKASSWTPHLNKIRAAVSVMKDEMIASGAVTEAEFDRIVNTESRDAERQLFEMTTLLGQYEETLNTSFEKGDLTEEGRMNLQSVREALHYLTAASLHQFTQNDFIDLDKHKAQSTGIIKISNRLLRLSSVTFDDALANAHNPVESFKRNTAAAAATYGQLLNDTLSPQLQTSGPMARFFEMVKTAESTVRPPEESLLFTFVPKALPLNGIQNKSLVLKMVHDGYFSMRDAITMVGKEVTLVGLGPIDFRATQRHQVAFLNDLRQDYTTYLEPSSLNAEMDGLDPVLVDALPMVESLEMLDLTQLDFLVDPHRHLLPNVIHSAYAHLRSFDAHIPGSDKAGAFQQAVDTIDPVLGNDLPNQYGLSKAALQGNLLLLRAADGAVLARDVNKQLEQLATLMVDDVGPAPVNAPDVYTNTFNDFMRAQIAQNPAGGPAPADHLHEILPTIMGNGRLNVAFRKLVESDPEFAHNLVVALDHGGDGQLDVYTTRQLVALPAVKKATVDHFHEIRVQADPAAPIVAGQPPILKHIQNPQFIVEIAKQDPSVLDGFGTWDGDLQESFIKRAEFDGTLHAVVPRLATQQAFRDKISEWLSDYGVAAAGVAAGGATADQTARYNLAIQVLNHMDQVPEFINQVITARFAAPVAPGFTRAQQQNQILRHILGNPAFLQNRPDRRFALQSIANSLVRDHMVRATDNPDVDDPQALDQSVIIALLTSPTYIATDAAAVGAWATTHSVQDAQVAVPLDVKRELTHALERHGVLVETPSQKAANNKATLAEKLSLIDPTHLAAEFEEMRTHFMAHAATPAPYEATVTLQSGEMLSFKFTWQEVQLLLLTDATGAFTYRNDVIAAANKVNSVQGQLSVRFVESLTQQMTISDRIRLADGLSHVPSALFPETIAEIATAYTNPAPGTRPIQDDLDKLAAISPTQFLQLMTEVGSFRDLNLTLQPASKEHLEHSIYLALTTLTKEQRVKMAATLAASPQAANTVGHYIAGELTLLTAIDAAPRAHVAGGVGIPTMSNFLVGASIDFANMAKMVRSNSSPADTVQQLSELRDWTSRNSTTLTVQADMRKLLLGKKSPSGENLSTVYARLTETSIQDPKLKQEQATYTQEIQTAVRGHAIRLAESGDLTEQEFVTMMDSVKGVLTKAHATEVTEAFTRHKEGLFRARPSTDSAGGKALESVKVVAAFVTVVPVIAYVIKHIPGFSWLIPNMLTAPIDRMDKPSQLDVEKRGTTANQKFRIHREGLAKLVEATLTSDASFETKADILKYYSQHPKARHEILQHLAKFPEHRALFAELTVHALKERPLERTKLKQTKDGQEIGMDSNRYFDAQDPMYQLITDMMDSDTNGDGFQALVDHLDSTKPEDAKVLKTLYDISHDRLSHVRRTKNDIKSLDSPTADRWKRRFADVLLFPSIYRSVATRGNSKFGVEAYHAANIRSQSKAFMSEYRRQDDPQAWLAIPENGRRFKHLMTLMATSPTPPPPGVNPKGRYDRAMENLTNHRQTQGIKRDLFEEFAMTFGDLYAVQTDHQDLIAKFVVAAGPQPTPDEIETARVAVQAALDAEVAAGNIQRVDNPSTYQLDGGKRRKLDGAASHPVYFVTDKFDPETAFASDASLSAQQRTALVKAFSTHNHADVLMTAVEKDFPYLLVMDEGRFGLARRDTRPESKAALGSQALQATGETLVMTKERNDALIAYLERSGRIVKQGNKYVARQYDASLLAVPRQAWGSLPATVQDYLRTHTQLSDADRVKQGFATLDASLYANMTPAEKRALSDNVGHMATQLTAASQALLLADQADGKPYRPGVDSQLDAELMNLGLLSGFPLLPTTKKLDIPFLPGNAANDPSIPDDVKAILANPNSTVSRQLNSGQPFEDFMGASQTDSVVQDMIRDAEDHFDQTIEQMKPYKAGDHSPVLNPTVPLRLKQNFYAAMLEGKTKATGIMAKDLTERQKKAAKSTMHQLVKESQRAGLTEPQKRHLRESFELFYAHNPTLFFTLLDAHQDITPRNAAGQPAGPANYTALQRIGLDVPYMTALQGETQRVSGLFPAAPAPGVAPVAPPPAPVTGVQMMTALLPDANTRAMHPWMVIQGLQHETTVAKMQQGKDAQDLMIDFLKDAQAAHHAANPTKNLDNLGEAYAMHYLDQLDFSPSSPGAVAVAAVPGTLAVPGIPAVAAWDTSPRNPAFQKQLIEDLRLSYLMMVEMDVITQSEHKSLMADLKLLAADLQMIQNPGTGAAGEDRRQFVGEASHLLKNHRNAGGMIPPPPPLPPLPGAAPVPPLPPGTPAPAPTPAPWTPW